MIDILLGGVKMGLFDKIKGATDKIKNAAKSVVDKAGSALDERTIRKNNEMLKYGEYVCDFENCRGDFQSDVDVRKNEKGLLLVIGNDRKKVAKKEKSPELDIVTYQIPDDYNKGTFRLKTVEKTKQEDVTTRVPYGREGRSYGKKIGEKTVHDRYCFDITLQFKDKKILIGELEREEQTAFRTLFDNANFDTYIEETDVFIKYLEKENAQLRDDMASGEGDSEQLTEKLQANTKVIEGQGNWQETVEKVHEEEIARNKGLRDGIKKAEEKLANRKKD